MLQDFSIPYFGAMTSREVHKRSEEVMSSLRASHGIRNKERHETRDFLATVFGNTLVFRTGIFSSNVLNGVETIIPEEGDTVSFIAKISPATGGRKRKYFTNREQIHTWLFSKQKQYGIDMFSDELPYLQVGSREYGLPTVLISGNLSINDKSKVTDLLKKGLGTNKAYGCGMFMFNRV